MAGRRRNPYPGLVAVALLPALLLGGCWRFAQGRAPDEVSVAVDDEQTPATLPAALGTPLLSVRRAPATLSRAANASTFTAELQPLLDRIDSTSCFSLSIDGAPVAAVNDTIALRPASNVKLITAAVALEVLGPDFVYTTTVNGVADSGER